MKDTENKIADVGDPAYQILFNSLIVSGRYPENPAIWLVPGAGSIFLSPDHGHGNQLR